MSDDSLVTALSGFSGLAAGVRDILVPHFQAQYQARLNAQAEEAKNQSELRRQKDLELYKTQIAPRPREIFTNDQGEIKQDIQGDPGQKINVTKLLSKKQGQHLILDAKGGLIKTIPASEGSGDTVTKIGENTEDKLTAKKISLLPKAKMALTNINQNLDKEISLIDEVLKDPSLGKVTGPIVSHAGTLTAGQARVRSKVDQLKAQAFLGSFQALKQASPNGSAGTGALSDNEGMKLEKAAVNLDTRQQTSDFVKALGKYRTDLLKSKQNFKMGFDEEFGGVGDQSQSRINPKVRVNADDADTQTSPLLDQLIEEHSK